jgi:hypothetical protein
MSITQSLAAIARTQAVAAQHRAELEMEQRRQNASTKRVTRDLVVFAFSGAIAFAVCLFLYEGALKPSADRMRKYGHRTRGA